ncbi:uncharacterized protein [Montipora foliosa]
MVDIICSSEYLRKNLIFRNTTRARNTAIYTDVVKQLKERLASRGENFPFDVTQTRNKFKKCVAECKKAALTIKTATGIKRFQEEKNLGEWFNQLYSFVKTRDSCTPEMALEPSCSNSGESPETVEGTEAGANSDSGEIEEENERARQHEMRLMQMMMAPPQLYYSGYPAQGAPVPPGHDQSITAFASQQGSLTRSSIPYSQSSTPASVHQNVYFSEKNESYFSL